VVGVPEVMVLAPGQSAAIAFDVMNTGSYAWTAEEQVQLENVGETALSAPSPLPLRAEIPPLRTVRWTVPIVAPQEAGLYGSQWQMTLGGEPLGPVMSALIFVSPNLEPGDLKLDPVALFQEWIRGLFDQLVARLQALLEELWRQIVEWLNMESERLLQELLDTLARQCCGAALVPPAVVLMSALGLIQRRRR
jgi:hypothetical protein